MSVRALRKMTSMPVGMCAQAWKDSGENIDKAVEILKTKGADKIQKLQDREVKAGWLGVYCHHNGSSVGMVELQCETDFVANSSEFRDVANQLAMQAASEDGLFSSEAFTGLDSLTYPGMTVLQVVEMLSAKTGEKISVGKVFSHRLLS
jgi:translation elongation factor EF-Ts